MVLHIIGCQMERKQLMRNKIRSTIIAKSACRAQINALLDVAGAINGENAEVFSNDIRDTEGLIVLVTGSTKTL